MKSRSVRYNFIMRSISNAATILVPLLVYPHVSRVLCPEGIGRVNFAQSVVYYFVMLAQLGVPTYGIRECARLRGDRLLLEKTAGEILFINIISCCISYALFLACLFAIPRLREDRLLFLIMSLSIFLNSFSIEWLYGALEDYGSPAVWSLVFKLLMVAGCFLFVKTGEDVCAYGGMLVLGTAGYGAATILFSPVKLRLNFNRKHIKPVLVFFAMSFATTIYTQMDSVMLGFMKGTLQNGYYDAAVKVKLMLVALISSMGTVLMPRAAAFLKEGDEKSFLEISEKAFSFVFALALPLCVYFIMYSKDAVLFLSGESFLPSVMPMRLIMPTLVFIGITNISGIQIMVPLGREKQVLFSEIAGALVNLVANALLIPEYGASGAAVGTVLAELAVMAVQLYCVKDLLPGLIGAVPKGRISAALLISAAAAALPGMTELGSFLKLLVSAAVFFGIYFGLVAPCYKEVLKK